MAKKYCLLVVLLLLTIIALVGLLILRQQQIIQQLTLRPPTPVSWPTAPPNAKYSQEKGETVPLEVKLDKITAAEMTSDCRVKVTAGEKITFLKTGMIEIGSTSCTAEAIGEISSSGYFLTYSDLSGGVDSVLKLYSAKHEEAFTLGVFGTSAIFDTLFLPNEKLVMLNGYHGLPAEQTLTIYDIPKIIQKIPGNLDEYRYIRFSEGDEKQLPLPKSTEDFDHFYLTADSLQILSKEGEILTKFKLQDL